MRFPWHVVALASIGTMQALSQNVAPAPQTQPFTGQTAKELADRAKTMLREAKDSPSGSASITLQSYPGHSTMLTVRVKSGGAEQHQHFNDVFFILEGDAVELVGGTLHDAKEVSPGELRGTSLQGAAMHELHQGDVAHIASGAPHQLLVAPGKMLAYYVVKVEQR